MQWTVIIPVKALPNAKSRLTAASPDDAAHARLVTAMRRDTAHAARNTATVARVLIVADREVVTRRRTWSSPSPGSTGASRSGVVRRPAVAGRRHRCPGGRSSRVALARARGGSGRCGRSSPARSWPTRREPATTLLTARAGVPLRPAFGPGSAARHARRRGSHLRRRRACGQMSTRRRTCRKPSASVRALPPDPSPQTHTRGA